MIIRGAILRKATGTDKSKVSYNIHLDKEIKVGLKKLNNIVVMGNLPTGLPEGLFMEFDVPNPNKCTDCVGYSIRITDRNRSVFKGYIAKKYKDIINNEDELQEETDKFIEKFCLQMKVHQEKDCTWAEAGLIDNPYVLEDWAEADKLGKEFGYAKEDYRRLNSLMDRCIEDFRGSRKYQYSIMEFLNKIRKYEDLGSYGRLPSHRLIKLIVDSPKLIYTDILSDKEILEAKKYIRKNIAERQTHYHNLISDDDIDKYLEQKKDKNNELAKAQRECVKKLANTRPTIITGGAGTGKTSTTRAIIYTYCHFYDVDDICLLAPTGKAARRMAEATGMNATTIHSRLRKTPDSDYICYNEDRPLEYKVYIVDEASMVDDLLMSDLLKAIPNEAKLYLVGDSNQLYPVGVGEPFHEMIENGACDVVVLTENFRQKGNDGILSNAIAILQGDFIKETDCFNIKRIDKKDILSYISENTQCISPYNELNDSINKVILNEHSKEIKYGLFFEGEKVIATKNTKKFANGDVGIIKYIGEEQIHIEFYDKEVLVDKEDWKLIIPAYSLTVHKCQGSEYEAVNIFLPYKPNKFVNRRLVYTAITRAKKTVNLYLYNDDEIPATIEDVILEDGDIQDYVDMDA